jgi:hypothetical protein
MDKAPMMKILTTSEAQRYLATVGMAIGDWNQIVDISIPITEIKWINYEAPSNARDLLRFSCLLSDWLPKGEWKLLQFDSSNLCECDRTSMVERLLFGSRREIVDLAEVRSVLFQFSGPEQENNAQELLVKNLIFAILLLEGHAYVVSSQSTDGQVLGLQDGVAYFLSRKSTSSAEMLLQTFEQGKVDSQ